MTDVSMGGAEYFAHRLTHRVWLFSNDDPPPTGFNKSAYDWVKSEKLVSLNDIDELISVETTCMWRGHHFKVGIISNALAEVFIWGRHSMKYPTFPGWSDPTNMKSSDGYR